MAGRFANKWKNRSSNQGTTADVESAAFLDPRERRQQIAKNKSNLSTALDRGHIEDALQAANNLLELGENPPNDLLYRLLSAACDTPGVERFTQAVVTCTKGDIRFDVMGWAAMVGRLMARDSPHAQVRVILNFGCEPGSKPMELTAVEANRESDIKNIFQGAEHLDMGELSDPEDLATVLKNRGRKMPVKSKPKSYFFSGCSLGRLNGTYTMVRASAWESKLSAKPVYKKRSLTGDRESITYCYYYEPTHLKGVVPQDGEEEWNPGWYLGTEVGGGGTTFAWCNAHRSNQPPPLCTWHVIQRETTTEEMLGFSEVVENVNKSAEQIVEWEEARFHLEKIDLQALVGRVDHPDPMAGKYFRHFFILLHLEALAEVAGFRGRFGFRNAKELASFGIALINIEYEAHWGFTDEARRMPLPGWPDVGQEKVAFKLPRGLDKEKFGIKRGESVLISRGEPLKTRIAEGSVTECDLEGRQIIVNINGRFPDFDFRKARFRIDCYANRTTFERQCTGLLQFVTMQRTRMQDMLIAAGVGKVDLAVLGGDGFAAPGKEKEKQKQKLAEEQAEKAVKIAEAEREKKEKRKKQKQAEQEAKEEAEKEAKKAAKLQGRKTPTAGIDDEDANMSGAGGADANDMEVVEADANDMEVVETDEIDTNAGEPNNLKQEEEGALQEDNAAKMAKMLAEQMAADFDEDALADEPVSAPQPESAVSLPDDASAAVDKQSTGEASSDSKLEEVKAQAALDAKLSEEEIIKRNTLAIADEDAEGICPRRLAETKEVVKTLPDLSMAQRNAITNSLSKRLTIVQGPPGTGKTHTSVRILTLWAKHMKYTPLLASSECNIAVDNIAEGLAKAGVKVCRIGRPEKVREVLEPVCLDNMVKIDRANRHKQQLDGEGYESDLEELGEEPWDEHSEEHREWLQLRKKWQRKKAWDRKQDGYARARFVQEAEVICSTTTTAGSKALEGFKFHAILIDEVAQATEISALVPIICRGAKQIALCGDHCQLPPSTISREAELRGMSLSMYSRLVEAGVPFQFLDTQYRAHPNLMQFSAKCIYQGKLKNGIDGSKRPVPKGIPWPNPNNPAAFFECGIEEGLNGESKDNPGEADMVLEMIENCLKAGELGWSDIGVVAPYKGQVRTLRSKLIKKFPEAIKNKDLEIASVDNFQGREKELIIFSAVRCNKIGSVGFLCDWRRLNVMITRARRGLVVVGNAQTLACDRYWRLWMEFTELQGGCPKGTVKNAIEEAIANLDSLGNMRLKNRIFPREGWDTIADFLGDEEKTEDLELPYEAPAEAPAEAPVEEWESESERKTKKKKPKEKKNKKKKKEVSDEEEWEDWGEWEDEGESEEQEVEIDEEVAVKAKPKVKPRAKQKAATLEELTEEPAQGKKRPIEEVDNIESDAAREPATGKKRSTDEVASDEEAVEIEEECADVSKSIGKSCSYNALNDDEADDENFKVDEESTDGEQQKGPSEAATPWDFLGWGSAGKALAA